MDTQLRINLRVFADVEQLSRQAAAQVARLAAAAVARQGRCMVALAGGSTPRLLYALLARDHTAEFPWSGVHLFWGDERYVPHTDPHSNYFMVHETLLRHVPIPPENVHPMPTSYRRPEEAAAAYERTLKHYFRESRPRFDLVLLGLGVDGHTASLFPGSPALAEEERWATTATAPAGPQRRLTLTFPVFNHAAQIYVLATGAEKAEAVRCALSNRPDPNACPAGSVRPTAGALTWWLDRAAARLVQVP